MDRDTCITTKNSRAMMANPSWWPLQTPRRRLCLKHRTVKCAKFSNLPRTAVMVYASDGSIIVWPWRDSDPTRYAPDPIKFSDVDEVLAAGYEVD